MFWRKVGIKLATNATESRKSNHSPCWHSESLLHDNAVLRMQRQSAIKLCFTDMNVCSWGRTWQQWSHLKTTRVLSLCRPTHTKKRILSAEDSWCFHSPSESFVCSSVPMGAPVGSACGTISSRWSSEGAPLVCGCVFHWRRLTESCLCVTDCVYTQEESF